MIDYSPHAQLERVATHKAGHAVAELCRGYPVREVCIDDVPGGGGCVRYKAKYYESLMDILVRSLAGPAAGYEHFGLYSVWSRDWQRRFISQSDTGDPLWPSCAVP